MTDEELKSILLKYVLRDVGEGTVEGDQKFSAQEIVRGWTRDDPERAWRFVEAAYQSDHSDEELGAVAAGALEDLLSNHGERILDRLEDAVRKERRARFMVAGVWRGGMSNTMWERFEQMRQRFGIEPI